MAGSLHHVVGFRTLKWYWVHDPENFKRLARYAHDMPDTSGKQGWKWRDHFKRRTQASNILQWDDLVDWLASDLEREPSPVLAILKVRGRPLATSPASTPAPRAGPTG